MKPVTNRSKPTATDDAEGRATMPMRSRVASLHGALWKFDRPYRLSWYLGPGSLALLICGWIVI